MAIDLKSKLKCLLAIDKNDKSLKQTFNEFVASLSSKMPTITIDMSAITSAIAAKKDEIIQSASETYTAAKEAVIAKYKESVTTLTDIQSQIAGVFETSCDEATSNNPVAPKTNPVAQILSLPSSNDDATINVSEDTKNKKTLENAKSQDFTKMTTVVGNINNQLGAKGVQEMREYIRTLQDRHPILDSYTNNLEYFQPMSEQIASSTLGYNSDKSSLQLADWSNNTPVAIKKNVKEKIDPLIYSEIQTAYGNLNKAFASNISQEFLTERKEAPLVQAHDFHIAGDYLFFSDHMKFDTELMKSVSILLAQTFGQKTVLINYLAPLHPATNIENDNYVLIEEGSLIYVDKRDNPVRFAFTEVNNNSLTPKQLEEV